jgi:hypothetical protein
MATAFRDLPRGQVRWIVPPNLHVLLTGAQNAKQDRTGRVTLTYTDGTTESRKCAHDVEEFDSFLALVSYVQAGRAV